MEAGEEPLYSIVREIKEELSIQLPKDRFTFLGSYIMKSSLDKKEHQRHIFFAKDIVKKTSSSVKANDLRDPDLRCFQSHIGMIDQQVPLFDESLRYNMTFGLNGQAKEISEERLCEIACMS